MHERVRFPAMRVSHVVAVALLAAAVGARAEDAPHVPDTHRVGEPTDALRDAYGLEPFHAQWVDAGGIPVLGSKRVHGLALIEAAHLIDRMLEARPDVWKALAKGPTRFVVMAREEMTTDVPEHADLLPKRYWDKRARGLGATEARPAVSCGEENLLDLDGDPYATENILIHEFAHAVHEMGMKRVDPLFDAKLRKVYRTALAEGLWKGTYAATNHMEYWAEGAQSWFDTNRENDSLHNHVDTRAEVREHDPRLATLLEEVFGDTAWRYVKPRKRKDAAHLAAFDRSKAARFAWPDAVADAYFEDATEKARWARREGEEELAWIRRRAETGDPAAQCDLGWRHRTGKGVDPDNRRAVFWFRRAVEVGDPRGQDHLAWMLLNARGVDPDVGEARRLFRLAANRRFAQAQYNLGLMARDGEGLDKPDILRAYMWFSLASRRGHEVAVFETEKLDDTLSAEQLAEARRLAREWSPD